MKLLHLIVGGALLASAGTAIAREPVSPDARLAEITAGRVAGQPVSCIIQRNIRSTDIVPGVGIVYRMNDGTLYINRPASGISPSNSDDIMVTRTYGSQLCRIDIVQLIDRNSRFFSGSFGLSDFEPYSRRAKGGSNG